MGANCAYSIPGPLTLRKTDNCDSKLWAFHSRISFPKEQLKKKAYCTFFSEEQRKTVLKLKQIMSIS